MVNSTDGLHLCSMSQHLTPVYIANSVNSLNSSFKVLISLNTLTLIELYASIGKIGLNTGFATCSHQDDIGIDIGDVLDSSLHLESDAALLERFAQAFGDIAIEGGQTLLEILDDRYLGAKATEH